MQEARDLRDETGQEAGEGETGPATDGLELIAYYARHLTLPLGVEPAPRWREWMNRTQDRWANRCLPLLMANESGWVLLNSYRFHAVWSGEDAPDSVTIEYEDADVPTPPPVQNYFGYGTLTWTVPYLFRTPPGWNLLVRGPANWPRDGLCALEGLVETDWSISSFTMNWKFTRPDHRITFEAGAPYCMVVPQRRGELERFRPSVRDLTADPELHAATKEWGQLRHELSVRKFLAWYSREFEDVHEEWQGHYFRGVTPDGKQAPEHETRRKLADFERPES